MKKLIYILSIIFIFSIDVSAQQGFGTSLPNANAVIDLTASNKGILLPRIALSSIALAAPLAAHVPGMFIYNTATSTGLGANDVTPGLYFNDGAKWVRFTETTSLPWYNVETNLHATSNQQNIYQNGNVGIGVGNASVLTNKLQVTTSSGDDPIRTQGLQAAVPTEIEKTLVVNPSTGVVNWMSITTIRLASYRSTSTSAIANNVFNGSTKAPLTFESGDAVIAPVYMTGGTLSDAGVFTITSGGLFDFFSNVNLSVDVLANYSGNNALAINFNIEKLNASTWTPIANTRTNLDPLSGEVGSSGVMSLNPLVVSLRLNTGDQIRFVVQRATGSSLKTTGTMSFIADNSKGVPFSKILRVVKLQ